MAAQRWMSEPQSLSEGP